MTGISVGVAVVCCLAALALRQGEPTYQGRTLTQWSDAFLSGSSGNPEEAIRAIGTNALPTVIDWLSNKHPTPLSFVRGDSRIPKAKAVLEVLGNEASPAVPALVGLTRNKDPEVRVVALETLVSLKADASVIVPGAVLIVGDTSIDSRHKSDDKCLRTRAMSLLEKVGLSEAAALEIFRPLLTDPNHSVAAQAKLYVNNSGLYFDGGVDRSGITTTNNLR